MFTCNIIIGKKMDLAWTQPYPCSIFLSYIFSPLFVNVVLWVTLVMIGHFWDSYALKSLLKVVETGAQLNRTSFEHCWLVIRHVR